MRVCILLFLVSWVVAAPAQQTEALQQQLHKTKDVSHRIAILDSLVLLHYLEGIDSLGEVFAERKYLEARKSRDVQLEAFALYSNGRSRLQHAGRFTRSQATATDSWLTRSVSFAQRHNLPFFEAASYLSLSELYGRHTYLNINKALEFGYMAQNLATLISNDSLYVLSQLVLAQAYSYKKNSIVAYRHLASAVKRERQSPDINLKIEIAHAFASFYSSLNDLPNAVMYAEEALSLVKQKKPPIPNEEYDELFNIGRLYFDFGEPLLALEYFQKAFYLAQRELGTRRLILACLARIHTLYTRLGRFNSADSLDKAHPELLATTRARGFEFLRHLTFADRLIETKNYDSALHYSRLAVAHPNASPNDRFWAYQQQASIGFLTNNIPSAARAADSMLKISLQAEDLENIVLSFQYLDSAHVKLGNYSKAYVYKSKQGFYRDSILQLKQERALSQLEVASEKERIELEEERREAETQRRHQLQYIAITILTALVFLLLVLLGVFASSKFIIKAFGFFAFILLFEFIILIADHKIHHLTHGEPWKVLAIKIGLIAILFPLHHYLEEKVVHHLIHRQKIKWTIGWFARKSPVKKTSREV